MGYPTHRSHTLFATGTASLRVTRGSWKIRKRHAGDGGSKAWLSWLGHWARDWGVWGDWARDWGGQRHHLQAGATRMVEKRTSSESEQHGYSRATFLGTHGGVVTAESVLTGRRSRQSCGKNRKTLNGPRLSGYSPGATESVSGSAPCEMR